MWRRVVLIVAFVAFGLAGEVPAGPAGAATATDVPAPIYHVFLTDGTRIAAFGEWARVGDRVVFTITLGEQAGQPVMHLASVPADRVDWPATERYRDGLRAATYAATRGDEDFAELTGAVARLLNDAALASDPVAKLARVERARQLLVDWPAAHYFHRAEEVRQILALVEEVISELKATRGDTRFDLDLVAQVDPPRLEPLPPPTLRQSIAQALRLAELAETPADRISLLRSVSATLAGVAGSEFTSWGRALRVDVEQALKRELDVERRYAALRDRALRDAAAAMARADVRGVERVLTTVRAADARLGARRPDTMRGLMEELERQLDAARRLRLARDQWALKSKALRAYRSAVARPLGRLARLRPQLDDIRSLAGPSTARLVRLEASLQSLQDSMARLPVPAPARAVHGMVTSAVQLAVQAAGLRRRAVETGVLQTARDASAAAAGSLMLADQARVELERLGRPPSLP